MKCFKGSLLVFVFFVGCGSRVDVATGQGGTATSSGTWGGAGTSSTSSSGGGMGVTVSTGVAMGGASSSSGGTSGAGGSAGGSGEILRPCAGHVYLCGDAIDNDSDGLVDAADPECTGACDNTEESYYYGIPTCCPFNCFKDCYFDSDVGSGNDECYWSSICDPHEVPPDYYPNTELGAQCAYDPQTNLPGTLATCAELTMAQPATCTDVCGPRVPNGCDCFGCCELPSHSGNFVWLGSVDSNDNWVCSTAADGLDPTKCHPCQPVPSCLNTCDACELCLGDTTLPGGCMTQQCNGSAACGLPNQPPCPDGFYCVTGCCQPTWK